MITYETRRELLRQYEQRFGEPFPVFSTDEATMVVKLREALETGTPFDGDVVEGVAQ